MLINVVDTEFNRTGTLIQIGAVQLDVKSGVIGKRFGVLINCRETLDPEIVTLTGITQTDVDGGIELKDGLSQFWGWCGSKNLGAWGSDARELVRQSRWLAVGVPEDLRYFDVSEMGQVLRCAFPQAKRGGLRSTLELFGLVWSGPQHEATSDAFNTARLLHRFVDITKSYYEVQKLVAHPTKLEV